MPGHQTAGVLGHVRRPGHADLHPTVGKGVLGNPGCGIRARAGVHDHPATGLKRQNTGEGCAPYRRQWTEVAEVHPHREAVWGDLVGGAQGAEQGRDHHQPAVGAASGGRVHRGEVERVIQNAGVKIRHTYRGSRPQTNVVGDVGAQVGADPQQGRGIGVCADLSQGSCDRRTRRGELREGEALEVCGLAPCASRLGLRGRKQNQHIPEPRRTDHGVWDKGSG